MGARSTNDTLRSRGGDDDQTSDLLERAAAGDLEAFSGFYEVVISSVRGVVRSVVRDAAIAEEVAQNVMIEIWLIAPRWDRAKGSGIAFAVLIARRRAIDCVRSAEARRAREFRYFVASHASAARDDTATQACMTVDHEVTDALNRLPSTMRDPILLAFYGGLTHRQIASRTGQPLGTVKTRIRSGLGRLRLDLQADLVGATAN